ncbi:MAG: HAD family phosphatase [Bacteroidaceae bacterium]|nr:HAD family phosphatase [Bacteroidaceae bacterium]
MTQKLWKAALFDLDGVVLNTERQYSQFWGSVGKEFLPHLPSFANDIKGQTLTQIYDGWFAGKTELQETITARLNEFERHMTFPYIPGFCEYITSLRNKGLKTAVVTSSNKEKMQNAYREHPELHQLFDKILTSEDFSASKPDPDCYLRGAATFNANPQECIVFEDSINGLRAAKASGAFVVGLATTLPAETVSTIADFVIDDFEDKNLFLNLKV